MGTRREVVGTGALTSALAVMVVISTARAEAPVRWLHDTDVVVDDTLVRGSDASIFVRVTAASGLRSSKPVKGARVAVALEPLRGDPQASAAKPEPSEAPAPPHRTALGAARTDGHGTVQLHARVPDLPPGDYALIVATHSRYGNDEVRKSVTIEDATMLTVRTDRGVYRAGDRLHWRVTAVRRTDAHPVATALTVTILDPRDTAIWSGRVSTDTTGMISGELPLGEDLVLGSYSIAASSASTTTAESFSVRAFRLAPFEVTIETDAAADVRPGQVVHGHVVARYPNGEPVAGEVALDVRGEATPVPRRARIIPLDAAGRASFTARKGTEDLTVTATVTDGAERERRAEETISGRGDALELTLVAAAPFVAGHDAEVIAITTDGRGHMAPARVFLKVPGRGNRLSRSSRGATQFTLGGAHSMTVEGTAFDASGRVARARLILREASSGRAIRPVHVVVGEGHPIDVTGTWTRPEGPVLATLLRDGHPAATAMVRTDSSGRVVARLRAPAGVFGLCTVRLTELAWDRERGTPTIRSLATNVYLRPARLDVELQPKQRRFRPGQDAVVDVVVRDGAGRPAAGVALSASVIDQRVLALSEPRPDLGEILRNLDVDHARAAGLAFADLLRGPADDLRRHAARALLATVPVAAGTPRVRIDAADRLVAEVTRLGKARPRVYEYLLTQNRPIGVRSGRGWRFADSLPALLAAAGLPGAERIDPWHRNTTWSYARKVDPAWTFAREAERIELDRFEKLEQRLNEKERPARAALRKDPAAALQLLIERNVIDAYLGLDPWGTAVRAERRPCEANRHIELVDVRSAGPDQRFGTRDDLVHRDVFHDDPEGSLGLSGIGPGGGGSAMGAIGAGRYGTIGHGAMSRVEVATRRRFDETVLWVAGMRTDGAGRARLVAPLADSITGWTVAVEAVSARGAVGAARTTLETSLPVHVDLDVPGALTVGDRFELTAVATNHTRRTVDVVARFEASAGARLTSAAPLRAHLTAGAAVALRMPIEAVAVGAQRIKVTLISDGRPVDAIERTLVIDPPGGLERRLVTAELAKGHARLSFEVASGAVPDSLTGALRLLRGPADLAMDGLEGMLKEPHGCFEQTSSTTYPNLLVLELLRHRPGAGARQARARARDYIAKGYQRLISYEVPGGGFSWFGEAPANQVLTAYGLMEFTDMTKVYPVDPELIAHTRAWLLSRQRRDGSWAPDESWLHDWKEVQGKVSTTAYIAWALAESGYRGPALTRALSFLHRHRATLRDDPYLLSLWAAAAARSQASSRVAMRWLDRYAQQNDGDLRYSARGRTLFYATGSSADVQVTAMAALALHASGREREARTAVRWLASARAPNYGWGTTQSTVLALRAAVATSSPATPRRGSATVTLDGETLARVDLDAPTVPTVRLPARLAPGRHELAVVAPKDTAANVDLRWSFRSHQRPRASAHGIEVRLARDGDQRPIRVGQLARLRLRIHNPGREVIAMPTVRAAIPPGFAADEESLAALVRSGVIARYEDQGSEVDLYVTSLAAGAVLELPLRVRARTACDVAVRPAEVYAYYDPATRGSSEPLRLTAVRPAR